MSLQQSSIVSFIPTGNATAAREFYETMLGLHLVSDDRFALVFRVGPDPGSMLRIVRTAEFVAAPFTIFGWEVADILASVTDLRAKGVTFVRYGFFQQDENDIWKAPGGSRVAWFRDPDGNTLSLSQHA